MPNLLQCYQCSKRAAASHLLQAVQCEVSPGMLVQVV